MGTERFVYFHGQPGAPAELEFALGPARRASPAILAPDRNAERPELSLEAYLDHLAGQIVDRVPDGPLRLVGFSLGGFVAVEVALRLASLAPERELRLDLISTAAPLACGDFLPRMAGGPVFRLARDHPAAFRGLTAAQGLLARAAPGFLLKQLFASAQGEDAALSHDPGFQRTLRDIVAHSLTDGARGYRREILGYVRQPPARLSAIRAPVTLWQGDADNWTPPEMAEAVRAAMLETAELRTFPGLSHYSTLRRALPEIVGGR